MDPYLEGPSWPDFHTTFIVCWRDALNRLLPKHYRARIDERINLIESDVPPSSAQVKPDVSVTRGDSQRRAAPPKGKSVATLDPVTIPMLHYEEVRETHIEIIGRPDNALIAVLELLSPFNKRPGAGQSEYLAKRLALIRQSVHLVELDLLLNGARIPLARPLPPGDYYAYVSRSDRRPNCEVYSFSVRDALPTVPIPLRPGDRDIAIDLQSVFQSAYERGTYDEDMNYQQPPPIALPEQEREWILRRAASADQA